MSLRLLIKHAVAVFALLLLVATPSLGRAQTGGEPASGDLDLKGTVEGRPATGLLGDWRIGGQYFSVTSDTVISGFGELGPKVGACVEVKYVLAPPPSVTKPAKLITPDDTCTGAGKPVNEEWKGLITARAEGGANGTWTIGGKVFEINDATFFEGFPDARPVANTCVEVTFRVDAGKNIALRIRLSDTCGGASDEHSLRGPVDARPDGTRVGSWVIGGRSFTATANSIFEGFSDAQPAKGDCVALRYSESSDARTILKIAPTDCAGAPLGDGIFEAHGLVGALPDGGTFGAWTIGGESYEARNAEGVFPATIFKADFGDLAVGVCTVVHYRRVGVPAVRVAMKIESQPAYRCTASAEEHELYGTITSLPAAADYLGGWKIGDLEILVSTETKLTDGPFYVGQRVEVKFQRAGDGTLLAISIEGKGKRGDEQDQRERGKAYGKIVSLPATSALTGTWDIAGASYTVNEETRFSQADQQPFAAGDCVEVYFFGIAGGARTALKISHAGSDDCSEAGGATEIGRAYGAVTAKPAEGYVGDWTVAGVTYTADGSTEFEAEHGALDVGAFVEVRYVLLKDGQLAKKIRTLVPPGAGDEHRTGELERQAPNALAAATTETWLIGGVAYQVNSDTMLNDTFGTLANGSTVQVNAYVDATTGARVATQVSAITSVYLPLVLR